MIRGTYLAHYGVKGMKWGVRRYQNYDGTRTAKGKERYGNTKSGMSMYANMAPKNSSGIAQDRFQEVASFKNERGTWTSLRPLNSEYRAKRFNQDYIDDPDSVFGTHMNKINRRNGEELGTTNNCTKVASSMCLARMGYDYDAGRSNSGDGKAFEYWFNGWERTVTDNLRSAIDTKLSKVDAGSFGTVDLRNKNGAGHVFNWEKNSKGEFNLYEGQSSTGEKYTGSSVDDAFDSYISNRPWFQKDATVRIYDMTNASPNFDTMTEDSVVRITDDDSIKSYIIDNETSKLYSRLD